MKDISTVASVDVSSTDFLLALFVCFLLSSLVGWIYVASAQSVNNRRYLASVLVIIALTTCLVITVVKSSLALSLGLVGALSVVRFRTAIKEPEELSYLFIAIGIGLATGAFQIKVALIAMAFIMPVLWLIYRFVRGNSEVSSAFFLNIASPDGRLNADELLRAVAVASGSSARIIKIDTSPEGWNVSLEIKMTSLDRLRDIGLAISGLWPDARLSFFDRGGIGV